MQVRFGSQLLQTLEHYRQEGPALISQVKEQMAVSSIQNPPGDSFNRAMTDWAVEADKAIQALSLNAKNTTPAFLSKGFGKI